VLDGVAEQPGMLEVTVAIPYLGGVRSRGAGAGNEDLAARQGLDVGHRQRRRYFEDGNGRQDLRSIPLLRKESSLAVLAGDDHSVLAHGRRPRRHGDLIEADPDGSRPSRLAMPVEMPAQAERRHRQRQNPCPPLAASLVPLGLRHPLGMPGRRAFTHAPSLGDTATRNSPARSR